MTQTVTAVPALTRLAEDEAIFRDSVYEFADREIRPLAREMDEHAKFSPDLIKKMFDLGVMSVEVPESYGGSGGTFFHSVLAVESLSRVDPSVGVLVDVQNTLVINAVMLWGSEEIKRKYLPRFTTNLIGAYCLSEAGSGSDAFAMATRATEKGDGFSITGRKLWITNGNEADMFIVFANVNPEAGSGSDAFAMATRATEKGDGFSITGRKLWITNGNEADMFIVFANVNPEAGYRGITAFIVDRGTPGFTVGKKEDKLGIRASSTCELLFEDCVVPKSQILGEVGKGYKVAIETLNEGRIGIGAQMLGLAQGALDHTINYVKERKQFGKPIADFQGVQFQIARMATDVEATRLLVYNCARLRDAGLPFLTEAAMCKVYSSEVAERVASMAINLYGGNGFVKEYPVEKLYRDAKIGQIYEGTTNMQLMTIAKGILG